jgi:hypothetical protein
MKTNDDTGQCPRCDQLPLNCHCTPTPSPTPRTDDAVSDYQFSNDPKLSPLATPRTDAATAFPRFSGGLVAADFARTLETELAAANACIARLQEPSVLHAHCLRNMTEAQVAHLLGPRDTLRAENTRLRGLMSECISAGLPTPLWRRVGAELAKDTP